LSRTKVIAMNSHLLPLSG